MANMAIIVVTTRVGVLTGSSKMLHPLEHVLIKPLHDASCIGCELIHASNCKLEHQP